jgi:hypothetical protein
VTGSLDVMVEATGEIDPGTLPPCCCAPHVQERSGSSSGPQLAPTAARFEDYIEHICRLLSAKGITNGKDPRIRIYLSMVMLEYPETLAPGRARERVLINAMAGIGRLLRFDTDV